MGEKEYISSEFCKFFHKWEKCPIALYGLSVNSGTIIQNCPTYHIVGLLDGYRDTGEIYGVSIISLQEAVELGVEIIVIVARASSVTLIANRIADFCLEHKIGLYDVHGRNCLETVKVSEVKTGVDKVGCVSIGEARDVINTHDVISFDIFDTLIMRQVLLPEDVFSLVETSTGIVGFAEERVQAEREANRLAAGQESATTFADIYSILQERLGLTCSEIESLQAQELAIEKKCLVPRRYMVALLKSAKSLGKRVFLISDMYWPENFLRDILADLGIIGWEVLYLSSTCGCTKAGGLYELFRKDVPEGSCLHIGDSEEADGIYPHLAGMDTWRLYSVRDMLLASTWKEVAKTAVSLSERTMVGLLAAHVMESPFGLSGTDGRPKISGGRDFGYVFVGPMLTAFLFWFLEQTRDCYSHLLFTARDGWLLMKMYNILRQEFSDDEWLPATYFYTSRSAAVSAWIETEEDVRWVMSLPFAGTAREMLLERFFLDAEDLLMQKEGETTEIYVIRHLEPILRRAQTLRDGYRKYIENCGLPQGRLAMLDFVASGTCQMCLERILGQEIKGYYFIRHFDEQRLEKSKMNSSSYIEEGYLYGLKSYLAGNYYPLENTIIGTKPSVAYFSEDGQPVFLPEKRSKAELDFLFEVETGCLDFFHEYVAILGGKPQIVRSKFADAVYSLMDSKRSIIENNIYDKVQVQDEFLHRVYTMQSF